MFESNPRFRRAGHNPQRAFNEVRRHAQNGASDNRDYVPKSLSPRVKFPLRLRKANSPKALHRKQMSLVPSQDAGGISGKQVAVFVSPQRVLKPDSECPEFHRIALGAIPEQR
jgi:hypothetical protein